MLGDTSKCIIPHLNLSSPLTNGLILFLGLRCRLCSCWRLIYFILFFFAQAWFNYRKLRHHSHRRSTTTTTSTTTTSTTPTPASTSASANTSLRPTISTTTGISQGR